MKPFLFRFGFCTPAQLVGNRSHRWDDESSSAFWLLAENHADALERGAEVAEQFTRHEFEKAGWNDIPSWRSSSFACWIEESPETVFSAKVLESLPVVEFGRIPDFDQWKS